MSPSEEEEAASRRTTDLVAGPSFTESTKEAIVSQSENCKLEITASAGNCLQTKEPLLLWITRRKRSRSRARVPRALLLARALARSRVSRENGTGKRRL
jgi:hypothetical protein